MKLLTFLLVLGVASCALSAQIKPSTSAKINPLSIKTAVLRIARQTRLGQPHEVDFITELIKSLRELDWNRVLDAFEVFLRNSKTHIQVAVDEVKAIEISEEIKDGIVSNLPGFAADRARELTEVAIEVSQYIVEIGDYFGFPEVAVAVAIALANLYVYGHALPVYLLWDLLEWLNSQEAELGNRLQDIVHDLTQNLFEEVLTFFESIYT